MLVLSLGLHEAAHGWVALQCGDTTARDLGRITLNPVVHIDPIMTILLPALLYVGTHGQFIFGGAKPVPVNGYNLRHPARDMALVALAGPLSNLLIAIVLAVVLKAVQATGSFDSGTVGNEILQQGVLLNIILAVFNLIPIPPLDGSRVMAWLLPESLRVPYARLEVFGMLIVMGLLITGVLSGPLWRTIDVVNGWVQDIASLGGLW